MLMYVKHIKQAYCHHQHLRQNSPEQQGLRHACENGLVRRCVMLMYVQHIKQAYCHHQHLRQNSPEQQGLRHACEDGLGRR
jgi:sulfur relay (sulfurtransferase) DsrF/TusC family protein